MVTGLSHNGPHEPIIFEVKDWVLPQITHADRSDFVISLDGREQRRKNPLRQAQDYHTALMEQITQDGRLVSKDPAHYGNPKVPIGCGVVFPNINKFEYCRYGLDKVIGPDKIFFWDDLHLASDISCDATGKCFRKALQERFPAMFAFTLTQNEYRYLKQLLFPIVIVDHPGRDVCAYMDLFQRSESLDDNQEAIARDCSPGCHLIAGPSGRGKTLILIHKAAFLRQYRPDIRNILFVCFNITLVNFIKRFLAQKGLPFGPNGVEVYHFYELCAQITGEKVLYEKEDSAYYELIEEMAREAMKSSGRSYDAVLVDEGQDFSESMFAVILGLVDPRRANLTVAVDESQSIYAKDLDWKDRLARGIKQHSIADAYRNSFEIQELARPFLALPQRSRREQTAGQPFVLHGPKPELRKFSDATDLLSYVAETIKLLVDHRQYPLAEIAILYTTWTALPGQASPLPQMFIQALESKGILSQWIAADYGAKRDYDITTERVAISTIHSAKGLDYACVFLVGLDRLKPDCFTREQISRLVYVGVTRARHRLFIPYFNESDVISQLLESLRFGS